MKQLIPVKKKREIKEEDLQLEPLCNEVNNILLMSKFCRQFLKYLIFHTSECTTILQEIKVDFQWEYLIS
jgi:hypothetical protein